MNLLISAAFFLASFVVVFGFVLFFQGLGLKYLGSKYSAYKARSTVAVSSLPATTEPSIGDLPTEEIGEVPNLMEPEVMASDADVLGNELVSNHQKNGILSTRYSHIILDKRSNARLFICHGIKPIVFLKIGNQCIKSIAFLADEKMLEISGHMALKAHLAQIARAAA